MIKRISYQTILKAQRGEPEAAEHIIKHYASYIASVSKVTIYDYYGFPHSFVDKEMMQQIKNKLLFTTILLFDPIRLPPGETLED